jgi:hypothetical protein
MVRFATLMVVIGVVTLAVSAGMAAVVTFDSELPGKVYGAPVGDPPGAVVLVEDGIEMSIDTFFWSGGGSTFNSAEIVAPPNSFAVNATQALNTNNISAVFDFVAIGPTEYVSIEFVDLGGNVNFDINGMGMQNVSGVTALAPMPPFNVNVVAIPAGGGFRGLIEVGQFGADDIDKLLIGGQELGIDTIRKSFFGDVNTDGTVNGLDVDPFVKLVTSGA